MDHQSHWFYVLYSLKDQKLYKGSTGKVGERLLAHTLGATSSTRNRWPLILIYVKKFDSKSDALKFERHSKTLEGGTSLKAQLIALGILDTNGILSSCT